MTTFLHIPNCIVDNGASPTSVAINVDRIALIKRSTHQVAFPPDGGRTGQCRAAEFWVDDGSKDGVVVVDQDTLFDSLDPSNSNADGPYEGTDVIKGIAYAYSFSEMPNKDIKDILNLPGGRVDEDPDCV